MKLLDWFLVPFFSYFIKNNFLKYLKLLKQKIKTLTDKVSYNLQCTKTKAKKNRFNQYILFCISPSQDQVNHSAAQKSRAGPLLINCHKSWNLCDCTTNKILQKPRKLCLFPAKYCLCVFYRQPVHCPLSCHTRVCTHTARDTHRSRESTKLYQQITDSTELCQM